MQWWPYLVSRQLDRFWGHFGRQPSKTLHTLYHIWLFVANIVSSLPTIAVQHLVVKVTHHAQICLVAPMKSPFLKRGIFISLQIRFFLFWSDLLEVLLHCICAVSTYSLYTLCCFLSYPCMEHAYNSFYNYIDRKWNTRKIWYLVSDIWIKIIATLYWYLNFSTAQHIINTIIVSQGFNISPLPVMVSLTITKCNRFKCLISLKLRTIHDLQHTCFIIFPLIIKAHAKPFLDKW